MDRTDLCEKDTIYQRGFSQRSFSGRNGMVDKKVLKEDHVNMSVCMCVCLFCVCMLCVCMCVLLHVYVFDKERANER